MYHPNTLNSFGVIEHTQKFVKNAEGIARKVSKLELCHLCASCFIIWIYIPIKVHANTLNSFGVMIYTQKFVKNKYKKNTYLQKMHFLTENWEPNEKNMASHESRDPEETMCVS